VVRYYCVTRQQCILARCYYLSIIITNDNADRFGLRVCGSVGTVHALPRLPFRLLGANANPNAIRPSMLYIHSVLHAYRNGTVTTRSLCIRRFINGKRNWMHREHQTPQCKTIPSFRSSPSQPARCSLVCTVLRVLHMYVNRDALRHVRAVVRITVHDRFGAHGTHHGAGTERNETKSAVLV